MSYNYSTEEEFSEERKKKFLIIGVVSFFSIVIIFFLLKTFIFKPKTVTEIAPLIPETTVLEKVIVIWPDKKRVEIKENVFVSLLKIEDYTIEGITAPEGYKFLSLEVELENKATDSLKFIPSHEWKIIDASGNFRSPIYPRMGSYPESEPVPQLRKPALLDAPIPSSKKEINPNSVERGYVSFLIAKDASIKVVVFQALQKKIIYQISPP